MKEEPKQDYQPATPDQWREKLIICGVPLNSYTGATFLSGYRDWYSKQTIDPSLPFAPIYNTFAEIEARQAWLAKTPA